MVESYNAGLWEITLDEKEEAKPGFWEVTLEAEEEDELGLWEITLGDKDEEDEDEAVEEEEESIPFDKDIVVTLAHQIKVTGGTNPYGSALKVDLPEGYYIAKAVSGACNDDVGAYWTWHVAGTEFQIVNGYSLIANEWGYGWAATAADALASVINIRMAFYWAGGTFKLWLPTNDIVVPTNNTGSCTINLKKVS